MVHDLIVIGAGSGGVRAARVAASFGARVLIVERGRLGGTCVNVGCVPKKLMYVGAHVAHELSDASGFGWTVDASFEWPKLRDALAREVTRLNAIYGDLLTSSSVDVVRGNAELVGEGRVRIGDSTLTAKHVLVATGSRARSAVELGIHGGELASTSDAIFSLPARPERLVVVGGGYIAVEFACIFASWGTKVTLVHRRDTLLTRFDAEIQAGLHEALERLGVELRHSNTVESITLHEDGRARLVHLRTGEQITADHVLVASGRVPATEGIGLSKVSVDLGDDGEVLVDEHFRSSVPWVHAIGDVIQRVQLTPVAIREGMHVAHHLFGAGAPAPIDYSLIPTGVFTLPQIGTVGLTERQARALPNPIRVFRSDFRPLKYAFSARGERFVVKLVVDAVTDRVLGCHMIGHEAAEIVQGIAIAITAGATKAQFDQTVALHPTMAESVVTMHSAEPG